MEALIIAFVAAALSEWGDKPQLLAAELAARSGRPIIVLGGVALVALVASLIAVFIGIELRGQITLRALELLLALALLFVGGTAFIRAETPAAGNGAATGLVRLFGAELGGRTPILIGALAARYDSPSLCLVGAVAGSIAAQAPAALLGYRFATMMPVAAIRWSAGALFVLAGFLVAISTLRLI